MSDWFSSKLKAAESILQKENSLSSDFTRKSYESSPISIDQQAAESLRKDEGPRSDDLNVDRVAKLGGTVPLKDQFKKRTHDNGGYGSRLSTDSENGRSVYNKGSKEIASTSSSPIRKSAVSDGDWTELLGTPTQPTPPSPASHSIAALGSPGARSSPRRPGSVAGSNFLVPELKRNLRSDNKVTKSNVKPRTLRSVKVNGKPSDGEDSSFSESVGSGSKVSVADHKKFVEHQESVKKETDTQDNVRVVEKMNLEHHVPGDVSRSMSTDGFVKSALADGAVDALPDLKLGVDSGHSGIEGNRERGEERTRVIRKSISQDVNGAPSGSDAGSDSELEPGSTSDSDSEDEHQREERKRRREKILAEKAAAKAIEAIRERENMVARLEGEKQSLEKIIEERAKQQAEEASELQNSMIETMEAADQEKQKHNNTRMEAFARLAKLETANADLAKSLAAAQWNLEIEVKRVVELRQQMELKELAHEELKRRISSTQQTGTSVNHLAAARGFEVERELLESEYALVSDKVVQLQEKARSLEKSIEMTRKGMEEPTEVEAELKRRLQQLTDHLIQKQAQVEALSSEKATLQFRIEAFSRILEENKSMMNMNDFSSISLRDVESGTWVVPLDSKTRTSLEDKMRSGKEHLGSLLRQLNAIFLAGAVFLRRNPTAKIYAAVYLVCLHLWVFYILSSHSRPLDVSGAVISLESINNSSTI